MIRHYSQHLDISYMLSTPSSEHLKVIGHIKIEDIQWFVVEYGIYFMSEPGYLIFSRVRSMSEKYFKILSH